MHRHLVLLAAPVLATLVLAACSSGGPRGPSVPERPRGSPPVTLTGPPSDAMKQCFADLARADVRFSPLPDRDFGGGCTLVGTVQLIDYGVLTPNLKAMTCPLARTFVAWVRSGAVPAAREILGSELIRVETMGTYSCRNVVGGNPANAPRLSQHAIANAVDVSGFVLADGRRITIEKDWRNPDPAVNDFLQTVRRSACRRFTTVLSPDYNAAHYNHLHIDFGGRPFCR